jgi:hypothetical protein
MSVSSFFGRTCGIDVVDPASASAKWNPRKIGFLKCLGTRFLWVSAIMTFGNPAGIVGVEVATTFADTRAKVSGKNVDFPRSARFSAKILFRRQ